MAASVRAMASMRALRAPRLLCRLRRGRRAHRHRAVVPDLPRSGDLEIAGLRRVNLQLRLPALISIEYCCYFEWAEHKNYNLSFIPYSYIAWIPYIQPSLVFFMCFLFQRWNSMDAVVSSGGRR